MRGHLYVIDSVQDQLLFRIDRKTARAKRYLLQDDAKEGGNP
jgi:type IV secretion system protein VirB9